MEGHAEYLSLYDWDDDCLRVARSALLSQQDLPAQALDEAAGLDLDGQLAGSASMSRPLAWAMFRYFDRGEDGAWSKDWAVFRAAMDGGGTDAVSEFEAAFGASPGSFDEDIVAWLATEQQPLTPSYMEWSHVGPGAVDGWADVFTIAPLKDGASNFSLRFAPPESGPWSGGVVLSFDDTASWVALVAGSDGRLSTFEIGGGEAWWWDQAALPELQDGGYRFEVEHGAEESLVRVNGEELVLPLAFSPSGGPALNAAQLRFTDIAWD